MGVVSGDTDTKILVTVVVCPSPSGSGSMVFPSGETIEVIGKGVAGEEKEDHEDDFLHRDTSST